MSRAAAETLPRHGIDDLTLARAKRGESKACLALVRAHEEAVFAVLGRMLRPRGLEGMVEDLAQETFLRAFAALGGFESGGTAKLSTWLLCIASRLAIHELNRLRPPTATLDDVAPIGATDRMPERLAARSTLDRALAMITPEQQIVLVLREFHGLDDASIAEVLGTQPGTIKARVFRARARLRQTLREEHGHDG
jgi:RNA polymerase sigma-70 factor (ECF subfamily)